MARPANKLPFSTVEGDLYHSFGTQLRLSVTCWYTNTHPHCPLPFRASSGLDHRRGDTLSQECSARFLDLGYLFASQNRTSPVITSTPHSKVFKQLLSTKPSFLVTVSTRERSRHRGIGLAVQLRIDHSRARWTVHIPALSPFKVSFPNPDNGRTSIAFAMRETNAWRRWICVIAVPFVIQ
jgi:hypothetical protein